MAEEQTVATVNGEPIPQQAVDFELQRLIYFYQQQGMPEAQVRQQLDALREHALEQAIGTKLLISEAHQLQIPISGDELDRQFDGYVAQFGGDREKLVQVLKQQNMTVETFKENLRQGAMINKLIEQVCSTVPSPTEADIKAHFEAHQDEYKTEDRVEARHILVKTDAKDEKAKAVAKAKLAEIRARIVAGKSNFEDEAKEHSDCPSGKSAGGSLGWFGRGMMVPEFEKVAFESKVNEISDILETQFGYHILIKTGEEKGHTPTLDEVHDKVRDFLYHAARGQAVSDHVKELRAKADIKIG